MFTRYSYGKNVYTSGDSHFAGIPANIGKGLEWTVGHTGYDLDFFAVIYEYSRVNIVFLVDWGYYSRNVNLGNSGNHAKS